MESMLIFWVLIGVVVVVAIAVVVFLLRRKRAPKYDTYQPGEYHSTEEAAKGPGPQRPMGGPGGVPIGFQ